MHLKHIKLCGFKSFVDSTTVSVPAQLVGIVGPNGCGKSNVIDAIRWVMGESSAKTLRGDSMDDVIFNGSSTRKPVSKAWVELVFDNSDGTAPGNYARFNELAIRRELIREGAASTYFINKTRCRRKDIHDIFLGTGLGPRSYSIIEQGMVGRVVESRPEELRVLIEEAAGISKYKERRRETENRIRRTRDNLSRVQDILQELGSQLRRLKRQSNAAARYKGLKEQQRELTLQLHTVRWRDLEAHVRHHELEMARLQTEYEARIADQREAERSIEEMRVQHSDLTEELNQVQAEYYAVGGEIATLEQGIQHARETRTGQSEELARLDESEKESRQHLESDSARLQEVEVELQDCLPRAETVSRAYEAAAETLEHADRIFNEWQQQWEAFNRDAVKPDKDKEVQTAYIDQANTQLEQSAQRREKLEGAIAGIDTQADISQIDELREKVSISDASCNQLEAGLEEIESELTEGRKQLEATRNRYNSIRHGLQDDSARLKSLRELQAAAMGTHDEKLSEWIQQRGLDRAPRLAAELEVEKGWEPAVDCLLGKRLSAIVVPNIENVVVETDAIGDAELFLIEPDSLADETLSGTFPQLADRVRSKRVSIRSWLRGVYAANDLPEAFSWRSQLGREESVVTRDGVWMGRNWVVFGSGQGTQAGMLKRETEIEALEERVNESDRRLRFVQKEGEDLQNGIQKLEHGRDENREKFRQASQQRTGLQNELGKAEVRHAELLAQREQMESELGDVGSRIEETRSLLVEAQTRLSDAVSLTQEFATRLEGLSGQRESLRAGVEQARQQADQAREAMQVEQLAVQRLEVSRESLGESKSRLEQQLKLMLARRTVLEEALSRDEDPEQAFRSQLKELVGKRAGIEGTLAAARDKVSSIDSKLRERDTQRAEFDQGAQVVRTGLDDVRLQRQEVAVRRDTISEQVERDYDAMLEMSGNLAEELDEDAATAELESVAGKIERIGPVNLVAIEEYEECSERKVYLDNQNADLTEALTVLEDVISKIDGETRARFKDTFDKLNLRFKEFFPKLFGGGSAYLEMTGDDLLDAGVTVMARPPGKRNSTIHLLSGGEKALAAVSLLFGFFDLNPAPFCVLDEVDAPLDDANVERYTEVLKSLGERTQLLFITHNKITMEASNILIGVTMAEPGVSNLVSVDVEEAVSMAAQ